MPAAQVLIYPAIEPSFDTESYRKYSTGYVNTRDAMQWYWRRVPRRHHADTRNTWWRPRAPTRTRVCRPRSS